MTRGRPLAVAAMVALACSRAPSTPAPPTDPTAGVSIAAPSPDTPTTPSDGGVARRGTIDDWIVTRLRKPGLELMPLEYDWQEIHRARSDIVATRSYWVQSPAIWLLVVRFTRHADAASAREPLLGTVEGPPYGAKTATSGAYLLIAGFASHKPVSPEMDRALDGYLSAFAGEE